MNNMQCPLSWKPAKQCLKVPFFIIVMPIIVWQCKLLIQTLNCISFHVVLSLCSVLFFAFSHVNFKQRHATFTLCWETNILWIQLANKSHVWHVILMVKISHVNTYHHHWRYVPPVVKVPFHQWARRHCRQWYSFSVSSPKTAMLCVHTVRAPWRSSFPRRRAASCSPFTTTVP